VSARPDLLKVTASLAERAVPVVLAATIVAFAMGSSSVHAAVRLGHPLRWVMLLVLVVWAVPYGLDRLRTVPTGYLALVLALAAISLLSSLWSVTPRITFERAISFSVLVAAVVLLGAGALRSQDSIRRLFLGMLVAADVVAVAGLVLLVFDHDVAVQPSALAMPSRMRGFGENPNTASMLFALALPVAEWFGLSSRSWWGRAAAVGSCGVLYGSIMASGSRGAMLAAAAGTVTLIALSVRRLRQLVPFEAIALVFFVGTFQISGGRPSPMTPPVAVAPAPVVVPQGNGGAGQSTSPPLVDGRPAPSKAPLKSSLEVGIRPGLTKADVPIPFVPRDAEIGFPTIYQDKPIMRYGSGRIFAWLWAIREGRGAPALGFGFGTEERVFVDRLYVFQGGHTENSFVGMFLQLGVVGVALLLLPFVLVGGAVLRALRSERIDRSIIAASAGVAAAGFVIAFFQSYLYSVGNVATLSFWIAATIAIVAGSRSAVKAEA
jgi:hypothetical protein